MENRKLPAWAAPARRYAWADPARRYAWAAPARRYVWAAPARRYAWADPARRYAWAAPVRNGSVHICPLYEDISYARIERQILLRKEDSDV